MSKSWSLTAKLAAFAVLAVAFGATMIALSMRAPHREHDSFAFDDSWGGHSKRIEKQFSVQPDGELVIETDDGEISITGTDSNQVSVVVSERGSSERLERFSLDFSQTGNKVTITGREDREFFHSWGNNSLDVKFQVLVPKKFNFRLNTSGGDIALQQVSGTTEGETSGGNIDLTEYDGKVRLTTSGGDLTVRKCSGDFYLQTSGGNVRGESVVGTIDFETSGGNIVLRDTDGKLRASTSGGNIRAEVKGNKGIDLETSGGNIIVMLPKSTTGTVDATTSGGDVSCDLEFSGKIKDGTMHGKINGGGDLIRLETSGGNIEIDPLD
jgi:DUF4097 and DUF4098 domain-containing protein YvlB